MASRFGLSEGQTQFNTVSFQTLPFVQFAGKGRGVIELGTPLFWTGWLAGAWLGVGEVEEEAGWAGWGAGEVVG